MTNGEDSVFTNEKGREDREGEIRLIRCLSLTKREYFASVAMNGMVANASTFKALAEIDGKFKDWPIEKAATTMAVSFANALIDALNKEQS